MKKVNEYTPRTQAEVIGETCYVVTKNNTQILVLPDGNVLPGVISIESNSSVREHATATVKLLVKFRNESEIKCE